MSRFSVRSTQNHAAVRWLDGLIFPGDEAVCVGGARWWLVHREHDDDPAGFGGAKLVDDGAAVYFVRAGVIETARGHGLQRRLIRVRLAWGKRQGAKHALTYTLTDNDVSANNLIRCGFRVHAPEWRYAGDEHVYWIRDL